MPAKNIKILFFGDVVGSIGRQGIKNILPQWQKKYGPDLVIANIENLAHGSGLTEKTVTDIQTTGIQIYTGGNHTWRKESLDKFLDLKIATPVNDSRTIDQHRYQKIKIDDTNIVIVNLLGESLNNKDNTVSNPFLKINEILPELDDNIIIVDMHAELTSEKRGMGFLLDGKASAVVGTHTHVPTADAQILSQGTGYITDVGMVGAFNSSLGIDKNLMLEKFLTGSNVRHELPESSQIEINAVLLEIDKMSKKCIKITHLREIIN
jgi:polar amino acid transport system substrate-binding protein